MGKFGGLRCGGKKWRAGGWSTKAAISLKRVKIQEKLLWRAYRNLLTLFRRAPSPTLYGLLFPKIVGSQPPSKTPIVIISGLGKATNFKFGRNIHRVHPIKTPLKFWRKGSVGVSKDCPIFLGVPHISGTDKAADFKFVQYIHRVHLNNSPLKFWRKGSVGVSGDCPT